MVDVVRGRDVQVTVRKRAGYISLLGRFLMKVEGVLDASRWGYPVTTAFSSLNPAIGGIGCVIAAGGVSQGCVNKVKPFSMELTVIWITPGNCASYWKDQPGHPSEKLGGRTAPTCSRGYAGPQTMPKSRIRSTTHQPQKNR